MSWGARSGELKVCSLEPQKHPMHVNSTEDYKGPHMCKFSQVFRAGQLHLGRGTVKQRALVLLSLLDQN